MRIALVDDQLHEREQVHNLLFSYAQIHPLTYTVNDFECGEDFLAGYSPYTYDIIFMDIYMHQMNGIETARKIRELDKHVILVFLTSSGEHLHDAFSIHAFDYVEKPLQQERFFSCLKDAIRLLPQKEEYVSFTSNGVNIRLFYRDIALLRSSGHQTILTDITQREYTVYTAFSIFTRPFLSDERFLLTSRGILVNMDFISRFTDKDIILQNEMHVPITIRKQKQLLQTWYNYDFAKLHREAAERSSS